MIQLNSCPNVQIRSHHLEGAMRRKVAEGENIVDVVEAFAREAKLSDNLAHDHNPQRGRIHLTEDRTGEAIDLQVVVRSQGPQPMDGVVEFAYTRDDSHYGYTRSAVEEKFTYQHGEKSMSVYRAFGTGALTICDEA